MSNTANLILPYIDAAQAQKHVTHNAALTVLDSVGDVGQYSAITLGADGLPLIAYYDATNAHLKVVHCLDTLCSPYFRRR